MFKAIGKSISKASDTSVPDRRRIPLTTWVNAINGKKYCPLNKPVEKSAAAPVGGGIGMKCKNPLSPNTRKINPRIALAICAVTVNALLFEKVIEGCVRTPAVDCDIILILLIFNTTKLNLNGGI